MQLLESASNVWIEFPEEIIEVFSELAIRELYFWGHPDIGDGPDRFELSLPSACCGDSKLIIMGTNPDPFPGEAIGKTWVEDRTG
jgi:hypothetical protein